MTLRQPRTQPQTVKQSRMTQAEVDAALTLLDGQLEAHTAACADCAAAHLRTASGFAIWRTECAAGRELLRTRLALEHRRHYLAQRDRARAAKSQQPATTTSSE